MILLVLQVVVRFDVLSTKEAGLIGSMVIGGWDEGWRWGLRFIGGVFKRVVLVFGGGRGDFITSHGFTVSRSTDSEVWPNFSLSTDSN